MKKIILAFFFSIKIAFATCNTSTWNYNVNHADQSWVTSFCQSKVGQWTSGWGDWYSSYQSGTFQIKSLNFVSPNQSIYYCNFTTSSTAPQTCPTGQSWNYDTCSCQGLTCDWATNPPYHATTLTQTECSNATTNYPYSSTTYLWNFSWCSLNNKCYGREYSCPLGEVHDPLRRCFVPKPYNYTGCKSYYSVTKQVTGPDGPTCIKEWICKETGKVIDSREVSCGAGPVSDAPITNPDAPNETPQTSSEPKQTDRTSECNVKRESAKSSCPSPKILSFECNPLSGQITKSVCTDPTQTNKETVNSGDETTGATTKDIKDLSNSLPDNIKNALKDWFTDGSMPHLESIRGTLDANLLLDSDRNDKLDLVTTNQDAQLAMTSETNSKLDDIKNAINPDGMFPSLGDVPSNENVDTNADPDGSFQSSIEGMVSDASNIMTEFDNLKNIVSGDIPPPAFSNGSCPTLLGPAGMSVNLGQIGARLSPYSSIISILVYISIMFLAFKSVFKFFSRGVS